MLLGLMERLDFAGGAAVVYAGPPLSNIVDVVPRQDIVDVVARRDIVDVTPQLWAVDVKRKR